MREGGSELPEVTEMGPDGKRINVTSGTSALHFVLLGITLTLALVRALPNLAFTTLTTLMLDTCMLAPLHCLPLHVLLHKMAMAAQWSA
jgi:hypothetical protein